MIHGRFTSSSAIGSTIRNPASGSAFGQRKCSREAIMKRVGGQDVSDQAWGGTDCFIALLVFTLTLAGCSSKSKQAGRRYHLKGKVVSVNKDSGSVVVDAEAMPGFMDAMAMPYPVGERGELAKLGPGDEITADVVVTDDGDHLENIVITKKGEGGKTSPSSNLHQPH